MSYLQVAKKSLDEIRNRATPASGEGLQAVGPLAGGEPLSDPDLFAAMPISEFARAGLVIKIHSGVLGCDVLFASDDVPETEIPDPDLAVYRAAEMRKLALWRPDPADLHQVHAVKEVFGVYGATIASIERRASQDQEDHDQSQNGREVRRAVAEGISTDDSR